MRLSKNQRIIMWTLSVLLAALFVFGGTMKLLNPGGQAAEGFIRFGYPSWFRYVIGLFELVGGILLLIPRRAAEAGSFLVIIMLGALISHIRAGDGFMGFLPALLTLFAVGAVTWLRGEEDW